MNEQATRIIQLRRMEEFEQKFTASKIISVCSGKGGTGKSYFAANFAFALSQLDKKVLLVDLDYNFSNINILLNQAANNPLSEFFEQKKSLGDLISSYNDNLHLIFGDSGKDNYPRLSREVLDYFFISLNRISELYDYIIFDSAAGANEITIHQLIKSDYKIIVTSPEPTAIMDAYVLLKFLCAGNAFQDSYVVINKCMSQEDGLQAFSNLFTAVKHFLGIFPEMIGSIHFDSEIHRSIIQQELLMESMPKSRAAAEIITIAKKFIIIAQVANNNQSHSSY